MELVAEVTNADQARQIAIDWQHNTQAISWGELLEWQDYFTALAQKFDLEEEFKENGII